MEASTLHPKTAALDFLSGGGNVGQRIRLFDRGKKLIKFYNAYKAILSGKYTHALEQPAYIVWKVIWKKIEPLFKKVMEEDERTYGKPRLLFIEPNGCSEETCHIFS